MTRANNPAPSSIRRSRMARWAEFDAMTPAERVEAGIATVYTADRSQRGYADAFGPSYAGEAGFSRRLRVVWANGSTTLCCTRGMVPAKSAHVPGGYAEWTIR